MVDTTTQVAQSERTAQSAQSAEPAQPAEPAPTRTGSLHGRAAGAAMIRRCLESQAEAPARGTLADILGRDPLRQDARVGYVAALADRRLARRLDRLGPEWTVLHALPVGRDGSDLDHLVIGPGGVIAVHVEPRVGRQAHGDGLGLRIDAHASGAVHRAIELREDAASRLGVALGRPVEVSAVVVTEARTATGRPRVPVLRAAELPGWVLAHRTRLEHTDITEIAAAAERPEIWRSRPGNADAAAQVDRFDALVARVRASRRRRAMWTSAVASVGVAVGWLAVSTGGSGLLAELVTRSLAR